MEKFSEITQTVSRYLFPTLTQFIKKILIIPHSAANVERIFSRVNLNKTKARKKDSMEGIIFTKDYLK